MFSMENRTSAVLHIDEISLDMLMSKNDSIGGRVIKTIGTLTIITLGQHQRELCPGGSRGRRDKFCDTWRIVMTSYRLKGKCIYG